jgi:serine/threonine-protein kinase RsbW
VRDAAVVIVSSDPRYLCVVRAAVVRMAGLCGFDEGAAHDLQLAVDEACSNVIKYAYGGDAGRRIVVRFRPVRDGLAVFVEDEGLKADPARMRGRDLDDVRPGGLGLHFIRKTFDVVELDARKKKGNRLRLVRYLHNGHDDRHP